MKEMLVLDVTESSQVAHAKRMAEKTARSLGFDETKIGRVAIVVTEMASNLVKHAKAGQLLMRPLTSGGPCGLEVMSLDKGPGMANVAKHVRDGYSTKGSMGTGLGAVIRLSARFDIHSAPGIGTALMARLWAKPLPKKRSLHSLNEGVGAVCLAKRGEEVSGDAWEADQDSRRSLITVIDGLGHGPAAAEAAVKAAETFQKNRGLTPTAILEAVHESLHHTRGVAMAISEVDVEHQAVRFAAVGNITGIILSPAGIRCMVSHNGILGHNVRKFQEFTYPLREKALLVMHSDGLASRWSLDRYQGIMARHPSLIAGILYRDYRRENDDVTVVVARPPVTPGGKGSE